MDIASGRSALKTATELTRGLGDRLKSGNVSPDEIAGRIGEIYDYIVDSKDSLVDAKDAIVELRDENRGLKDKLEQKGLVVFHDGANWQKAQNGTEDGPFCPSCWADGLLHRGSIAYVEDGFASITCGRHTSAYNYKVPEQLIKNVDLRPYKQPSADYSDAEPRNYY